MRPIPASSGHTWYFSAAHKGKEPLSCGHEASSCPAPLGRNQDRPFPWPLSHLSRRGLAGERAQTVLRTALSPTPQHLIHTGHLSLASTGPSFWGRWVDNTAVSQPCPGPPEITGLQVVRTRACREVITTKGLWVAVLSTTSQEPVTDPEPPPPSKCK